MNCVWSDKEKTFIKEHAHYTKDEDMLVGLKSITSRKISLQALRKQRRKLGIKKQQGRGLCRVLSPSSEWVPTKKSAENIK